MLNKKLIQEMIRSVFNEENLDEERIANSDARDYVEKKENFLGTHIFAEKLGEDSYVVCSYVQDFPIFIYDGDKNKWYQNGDDFKNPETGEVIEQTKKHIEVCRPNVKMHTRSNKQMLAILKNLMEKNGIEELSHSDVLPGDK